jgi:hypothetical protein
MNENSAGPFLVETEGGWKCLRLMSSDWLEY